MADIYSIDLTLLPSMKIDILIERILEQLIIYIRLNMKERCEKYVILGR